MTAFVQHSPEDREEMLKQLGISSFDELVPDVPSEIRVDGGLNIPHGLSETETIGVLSRLAAQNLSASDLVCFQGGGIYDVCVPAATKAICSRPEYATAYTPYQAEVSQGTLQAIYEFQTMIARLTGMDLANASMYDGASACAEAVILALGAKAGSRVLVSPHLHPHYRGVLDTLLEPTDAQTEELPAQGARTDVSQLTPENLKDVCAVVLAQPNFLGALEDVRLAGTQLEGDDQPIFIVSVDLSSLSILDAPGHYGADIAVGEAQPLGVPMSFGGPVAGVFAAQKKYLRRMPGRIAGLGKDSRGQRAFTLAFQTREQHIRRARATSNICTNQALIALQATVTTALLGETGRRIAAELSAEKAHDLAARLTELPGVALADPDAVFFREFALRLPDTVSPHQFVRDMASRGYLAGIPLEAVPGGGGGLLVAVTEKRLESEIAGYVDAFRSSLSAAPGAAREMEGAR